MAPQISSSCIPQFSNSSLRIGLLGGSFNPAHEGHLHVSLEALKRLKLDAVWWLVSPQNPLKSTSDMATYEERFASALAVTRGHRHIMVSDFEHKAGLHYTYATLHALKRRYPDIEFVWLMGSDNLAHFHRWQRWREIAKMVAMAIFDRSPFSHTALHARAALALQKNRVKESDISGLASKPGKWAYILMRRHAASSTQIRGSRKPKN
jgi:nicotinate-nucleotide adenylyltransferase